MNIKKKKKLARPTVITRGLHEFEPERLSGHKKEVSRLAAKARRDNFSRVYYGVRFFFPYFSTLFEHNAFPGLSKCRAWRGGREQGGEHGNYIKKNKK